MIIHLNSFKMHWVFEVLDALYKSMWDHSCNRPRRYAVDAVPHGFKIMVLMGLSSLRLLSPISADKYKEVFVVEIQRRKEII